MSDGGTDNGNGHGDQPSDTMRQRVGESRWKVWVLMDADRRAVAGVVLGIVFLSLMSFSVLDLSSVRLIQKEHNAQFWLFSPMFGAIITGVTIVVTIGQLVLSQELGALGDQRQRMRGSIDFREDVEKWIDVSVSPPDPGSFLAAIIDGCQTYANAFEDTVADCDDEQLRDRSEEYVANLTEHARTVGDRFDDAQFGDFDVLLVALDFNYSWKIYEANRLRSEHADQLTDEADDALDDLIRVLEFFGPAREHFKTLYFQWELMNLSREILYASIPALIVTFGMLQYVDPSTFTGVTLGINDYAWVMNGATTVGIVPFVLLLSYILRIATVAKRTFAIGPFILRDTARSDDISWEE